MNNERWKTDTQRGVKIMNAVLAHGGSTRKEIAAALGLKKHPALIAQIEALVTAGYLSKDEYKNANGSYTFVYFASPDF